MISDDLDDGKCALYSVRGAKREISNQGGNCSHTHTRQTCHCQHRERKERRREACSTLLLREKLVADAVVVGLLKPLLLLFVAGLFS